jgi:recombination protein RecT
MTAKTDTKPLRQELEQVAQPTAQKNVIDLINRNEAELQKLLGKSLTVEQFKTAALTYLRLDPKLLECNPYSIVGGLRLGAQLGLSLGPLGHFYLAPHAGEAVFILGYRGMVELAYRSGKLRRIKAVVVREGDLFDYEDGTKSFLRYKHLTDDPEAPWTHVWALAELTNGGKPFEVLTPAQVEERRLASALGKQNRGPWANHKEPMWQKSSVRALQRWLPQTPEMAQASEQDETIAAPLEDDVQEVGDEE